MAGANILYGVGGLETGLSFDYGQAVLGDEIVRMIKHLIIANAGEIIA